MVDRGGAPQGWAGGETLTILVVEDDAGVAELLRAVLNGVPGWGATVVRDAAAAQRVGRVVRAEALVLDLHLPGLSGLELLARWRTDPAWPDPPVVLTTSDPEHPAVQAAVAAGAVAALVPKPFAVAALVAAVRSVDGPHRRAA